MFYILLESLSTRPLYKHNKWQVYTVTDGRAKMQYLLLYAYMPLIFAVYTLHDYTHYTL